MHQRLAIALLLAASFAWMTCRAQAQEAAPAADAKPVEANAAGAKPPEPTLADRQEQLAQRYRQLEAVLLRMAELSDDPQRVALLRKAVAQSKEQLIESQLVEISDLLKREQLANALTEQGDVRQDMAKLLELLLSEDRSQNVDEEKRRLQQWIRDISNLIKDQQGLQGETDGGADPKGLAERQGKLGEKTERTAKEIAKSEAEKNGDKPSPGNDAGPSEGNSPNGKPADGKPTEGTPGGEKPEGEKAPGDEQPDQKEPDNPKPADEQPNEGESQDNSAKPSEGQPSEGQPSEGQPSEGQPSEGQPSEGQPSEGQPSEGQPSEGQPSEGQPSEGQQQEQQPKNPTEQRLKSAQQRMEAAKKKLEQAEKDDAVKEQSEAIRELRAARAELEKILQQLREEEMQRTLAMLEQRFRKMLAAEIDVFEATKRIDAIPAADRTRNDEIEAGRQARRQTTIADDARKALELLKQDGTAVAFPEAVGQMIEDMDQAAAWLSEAKVGTLTQSLEQDIIASLEEMIAAFQKAQKDLEEQEGQNNPSEGGEQGQPPEPPLVNALAELKMIRSLQMWVNKRTKLYQSRLDEGIDPPGQADLNEGLKKLSERQDRIYQTTRDIVEGNNQ